MNIRDLLNPIKGNVAKSSIQKISKKKGKRKRIWDIDDYESLKTSKFFVTLNTNKYVDYVNLEEIERATDEGIKKWVGQQSALNWGGFVDDTQEAYKKAFIILGMSEKNINQYDSDTYRHEDINGYTSKGEPILELFDTKYQVEISKKAKRVHVHIIVNVKHRTKLVLNRNTIKDVFKEAWMSIAGLDTNPYVNIRALGDTEEKMERYLNADDDDMHWLESNNKEKPYNNNA